MSQDVRLQLKGLQTYSSPFTADGGSLAEALNVNIDSVDTATSRRGFAKYPDSTAPAAGDEISSLIEYDGYLVAHYGTTFGRYASGAFTAYSGTFSPVVSKIGIRSFEYNKALYILTSTGVRRLDTVTGSFKSAGVPKGITFTAALSGSSGFMATDTQTAYRVLWGYKDSNGIVLYGAPSERVEIANSSGGDRDVALRVYIPEGVTAGYFFQIYRSAQTSGADVQANDELQLVYEEVVTSSHISTGYIDVTDIITDDLRGATIYTAESQEGILKSNETPPLARDACIYKESAFYAGVRTRHRLYITLLGVGGSSGLAVDDVITIAGVAYTGKSSETVASGYFAVDTSSPTPAEQIYNTAKSLVKVINLYASNTVVSAYYVSGYDELPGKILIEYVDMSDTTFYALASAHGAAWNPVLPSSGTAVSSVNDNSPAWVYYSKNGQPDAVPVLQYLKCGSNNYGIMRIIPLRDSLFVLKENGEIYRIIGENESSFTVKLFDNSARLYGPRTAVVHSNSIYCFSDQGIVSISDSGVLIKAFNIEGDIIRYLSSSEYPDMETDAHAVSYESGRKYIIWFGTESCYVYNSAVDAWSMWDRLDVTAAFYRSSDDRLYLAYDDEKIYRERKDFTALDYVDDQIAVTVVSSSLYDVVLSSVSGVAVGMALYQSRYRRSLITAVDTGSNTVTVENVFNWQAGAAYVQESISCAIKFLPMFGDNPSAVKRFREAVFFFREMNKPIEIYFTNNFSVKETEASLLSPLVDGQEWGRFPWGEEIWGSGDSVQSDEPRTFFPLDKARALWANLKIVSSYPYSKFLLAGGVIGYDSVSTRFES